ncbi:hypothetical protein HYH03_014604 [Edaphochlamys debaryana]|uniref:Glycosyl transferase CAP10 domain-containing protein n=1 Tax=Edaphochlamys debaryana TaxID=47281 RepID=A0A836BS28_9CHLO|nr:hypothetical protein HYH03_014604 [Edaphochlamys debaryana]|eukprot:KAG2486805.1 hypothetical protein HYH03_014604 [Edaphochlamys debaryana]
MLKLVAATLLLLQLSALVAEAYTKRKLETCDLHPDLEAQIERELEKYAGTDENVALSITKGCNLDEWKKKNPGVPGDKNCNKPQRILVENGTVYLTSLANALHMTLDERIGFLVELFETSQVYQIPDVEFTSWFDDTPGPELCAPDPALGRRGWPHSPNNAPPPVVAWTNWGCSITVPNSGHFRCTADGFDEIERYIDARTQPLWERKIPVALGRWHTFCPHYNRWAVAPGAPPYPCQREVLQAVADHEQEVAARRPKKQDRLLDISNTSFIPMTDQAKFKYLLSADGLGLSCKLDSYLIMGSLVFKAEMGPAWGFYYKALKPYVHYIPVLVNASDDILEAVRWARANDAKARDIAEAGRRFALEHLSRPARLCYIFRLLSALSKRLKYKPTCERRELCVPLSHHVNFLSHFEHSRHKCRYHNVLAQWGHLAQLEQPRGWNWQRLYSVERSLEIHEGGGLWPQDDIDKIPGPGRQRRRMQQDEGGGRWLAGHGSAGTGALDGVRSWLGWSEWKRE